MLVENDTVISDDLRVAEIFNLYFRDITDTLNITQWEPDDVTDISHDTIECALEKYSSHPSIQRIRYSRLNKYDFTSFEFSAVTESKVREQILNLDDNKKTSGEIPSVILK